MPLSKKEYIRMLIEGKINPADVDVELDFEDWSAFETQVSGNHYTKLEIQPIEYSFKNKLDPCQHTAIKYITRFRDKDGKKDLEKAIHTLQMLIELEYPDVTS